MWWHRTRGTLHCRDLTRNGHRLEIRPHVKDANPGVSLVLDGGDPLLLTPLQVGWLRRQLRDTILDAGQLVGDRSVGEGGTAG